MNMGVAGNYLERGKWSDFRLQQLAILSIVINFYAIFNGLQTVNGIRKNEMSKLSEREWDLGDVHITSSSPSFTETNTFMQMEKPSKNIIKQRKMRPYSTTSYSVINSTKLEPTIDLSGRSSKARSAGNETNGDFYRILEELKKVVRARQGLIKRQQQTPNIDIKDNNSSNTKLEDNINTINVMIGMLMLANSKLIEKRDKLSPSSDSNTIKNLNLTFGEEKQNSSNKLEESQASSPITSQVEPKVSKNTSLSQGEGNLTTILPTKIRKFKRISSLKESIEGKNVTQQSKEMNSADHFSVKPGFDSDDATSNLKNNITERNMPSEAQYSGMLFTNPVLIGNRKDFLRNHKPIVAHDLLHVRPHQPDPALNIRNRHVRPENLFISHIPINRQPLSGIYEHLNQNRQPLVGHSMKQLPYEEGNINLRDGEHQRMVPPYNVHNVEWPPSTTTNPHPFTQNQFNDYPILQRLGEGQHYDLTPRPTIYPALLNNPHPNSIGGNELTNAPFINPLHQVLMAARNQQAAALDQDRRRMLEHEMEVQKRQQHMKKQHEDNLMNQKLAHDERQEPVQNNEKEQQQDPENQQSGARNHEDQGSQQGQQQEQAQNQGDSDGGNDQNSGQQGANEPSDPREDDKDMKNFQDFAGDTDFTDLFPPGILSDSEIREMKKQHQEQKQREQEEQEEKQRQAYEEEQANGEENSGQDQAGQQQQDTGEQTEQSDQTREGKFQKRRPDSSSDRQETLNSTTIVDTYRNVSNNNRTIEPQVVEPKYNVTISQSPSSKLEEKVGSLTEHANSRTTKTPRLFVPDFLSNSSPNNKSLIEMSTKLEDQQQQQPVANKRRRSHHLVTSARGIHLSHVENNELLPNGMIVLESEYQDNYVKPFMPIVESSSNNDFQQMEPNQATNTSGNEDLTPESGVDFGDQVTDKR